MKSVGVVGSNVALLSSLAIEGVSCERDRAGGAQGRGKPCPYMLVSLDVEGVSGVLSLLLAIGRSVDIVITL